MASDFDELTELENDVEPFDNEQEGIIDYYLTDENNIVNTTKRKSFLSTASTSALKSYNTTPKINNNNTKASIIESSSNDNDYQCEKKKKFSNRIDRFCEFALIMMHSILYKINYYNKKTHFDKYLKYNIIVYKCKSEIVNEYIINCIECMRLLMYKTYGINNITNETTLNNKSLISIGLAVLKPINHEDSSNNLLIKRYTLQIEHDDLTSKNKINDDNYLDDDWYFRDAILKCLYSKDIQYVDNFKWQIQLRADINQMKEMSHSEDLFKLFAWRECDNKEITSINTTPSFKTSEKSTFLNKITIKPIKTMNNFNNDNLRVQFFIEQPFSTSTSHSNSASTSASSRFNRQYRKIKKRKKEIEDAENDEEEGFTSVLNSSNVFGD